MIYFTADLHLNHHSIIRHCNRPFRTVQEMNGTIINNFNKVLTNKDILYILGDFAWSNHGRFINAINGKKILIRGNHDRMNKNILRQFTEVHDLLFRKFNNKHYMLCHYAMRSWRNKCHNSIHLYGHSHGRLKEQGLSIDVGVDSWVFRPVSLEIIEVIMERKLEEFQRLNLRINKQNTFLDRGIRWLLKQLNKALIYQRRLNACQDKE